MSAARKQRRHEPRISFFQAGLIALAVIAVLLYIGFTKGEQFQNRFTLKAAFENANNIKANSPVRIAGVNIGKVTKIEPIEAGKPGAVVTMQLQKKGLPVHRDATVKVRPRIFLEGNFFLDLSPGSPSAPTLEENATIPVQQTAAPVQFDQVLSALQADTRTELRQLLDQYGEALKGRGAAGYRNSIAYWVPAYRDGALVADATLGSKEHDLSGYVASAGAVARSLDADSTALKSLVTDFNTTAAAFAREQGNLRAAVAELPRTLRAADPALAELNQAFPPVRRLARDLRPGVRSTPAAARQARPLVRELRGLVQESELKGLARDLRPAVPALTRLTKGSVPLNQQVRRASSCQNDVIIPWSHSRVADNAFPTTGPVYQEAVKPLPGLAGESRSGDANGQWFRVLVSGGLNLVQFSPKLFALTGLPILGTNPPAQKQRPPNRYDVPCETQEAPNLASNAAAPPAQRTLKMNAAGRERLVKVRAKTLKWLTKQLKVEGLSKTIKVAKTDATKGLIERLGAQAQRQREAQKSRIERLLGR